ncbi:MAG TPA: 2Fe-2S iron-sulfur cluster binding domain-containing protein [Azospirillum sp.]|nr:2Fe-2S iron-sulfur cluster binding domain-containing protein [Azospirillum sp.]
MAGPHHTIHLDGTQGSFACRGDETVIAAMERAAWFGFAKDGGRIPVGCRRGGCGVCRVQVLEGPYRVEAMSRTHVTEAEQQEGYALACCLVPQGDLVLRLAAKPAKTATPTTAETP